jgi:hypothetical protein
MSGQDGAGIELGAGQQAQLGKDFGLHFLGFINQQYRPPERCGQVRFPFQAQVFEAGPAVVHLHGDSKDLTHLAVEVRHAALRAAEHTGNDIRHGLKVASEQPQRDRFAGSGFTGDESEAAVAHLLFDTPAEVLDFRCAP